MKTRREFLGGLGAVGVVAFGVGRAVNASGCPTEPTSVGVATVETHPLATVWLDGQKLDTCFYADDTQGIARCYKLNADGDCYLWGHRTADPDPQTRVDRAFVKQYTLVNGRLVWSRPYPGYGDVAWEEYAGDVQIVP